jgi:hypothetical protein
MHSLSEAPARRFHLHYALDNAMSSPLRIPVALGSATENKCKPSPDQDEMHPGLEARCSPARWAWVAASRLPSRGSGRLAQGALCARTRPSSTSRPTKPDFRQSRNKLPPMSITAVAPLPCNELAACNCLVGCPRSTLVSDLTSTSSVDAARRPHRQSSDDLLYYHR